MRGKELKWILKKIGITYKAMGEGVQRSEGTIQNKITWNEEIPEYWVYKLQDTVGSKARWKDLLDGYQKHLEDMKGGKL